MQLVSCLTVTSNRFGLFTQSVECFCRQDYANKELIVVTAGSQDYNALVLAFINSLGRSEIRCVQRSNTLALGALRNASVDEASGMLVCQWDDDDLYHPNRLSAQVLAMEQQKLDASYLLENFHLFLDTGRLYLCSWSRTDACLGHPGTLLGYREIIPRYNSVLWHGEDTAIQRLMVRRGLRLRALEGLGYLYMYVCHGCNTCSRWHHENLARGLGLERLTIQERAPEIRDALSQYRLDRSLSIVDYRGAEVFSRQSDPAAV